MSKILIVFTDPHLPYSPTVLNLFHELRKVANVKVLTPEPEIGYSLQKVNHPDVVYVQVPETEEQPGKIARILKKITNNIKPPTPAEQAIMSLHTKKVDALIEEISRFEGEIIAVDFLALWCVQQAGKEGHLISLEIHVYDRYRDNCSLAKVKSVLIQSEERYEHLFNGLDIKRFIVQNSPPYLDFHPEFNARKPGELVFCGSAVPGFGIFSCLDFISDYPEYRLTIKGAVPPATRDAIKSFYPQLPDENRLIIDDSYMDADQLTKHISTFWAGFVFYDFYRFENLRTFNYYTAPSGKMFQYFNSGVPSIGNRLPGLSVIEEYGAGKLVPNLSSLNIKTALDSIQQDYIFYAGSAKELSKKFDFATNIASYVKYLSKL